MKALFVVFVLLLQKSNLATDWISHWLTSPHDSHRCNRPEKIKILYICNPDDKLPEPDVEALETIIDAIRTETNSPCSQDGVPRGYTIRMSIMNKYNETVLPMSRNFQVKESQRMKDLVKFLHDSLAPDPGSCDDRITFLISVEDRRIASYAGQDVRAALEEKKQDAIDRESELHLAQESTKDAVEFLLVEYGEVLRGGQGSVLPESDKTAIIAAVVAVVLILTLLILAIIVFRWLRGLKPNECVDGVGNNTTTDCQSQTDQFNEKPTTQCPDSNQQIDVLEQKQPVETEV